MRRSESDRAVAVPTHLNGEWLRRSDGEQDIHPLRDLRLRQRPLGG
jgi:hypothetical protein